MRPPEIQTNPTRSLHTFISFENLGQIIMKSFLILGKGGKRNGLLFMLAGKKDKLASSSCLTKVIALDMYLSCPRRNADYEMLALKDVKEALRKCVEAHEF